MSRLTELLGELSKQNAQLSADLEAEITALSKQQRFGLVFERHQPEAVELPRLKPRKGSKVHVLPPRGSNTKQDQRVWVVKEFSGSGEERTARLLELRAEEPEQLEVAANDLAVVAEFTEGIYPGLVETGRVDGGGDKPYNTVINGENYHALEMLTYTHRHKVDAIYIDPPYNTGAKDWKYNNDYVDGSDAYRHSKWLAFMERRLRVAKELLKPEDSVLIVTIDEKEYLRLGMLLEQVFPEARMQMVSILISSSGSSRPGEFARSDEYAYFLRIGNAGASPLHLPSEWMTGKGNQRRKSLYWNELMRTGPGAARSESPNLFYPIYLRDDSRSFHSVGAPIPLDQDRSSIVHPENVVVRWPIRADGSEGRWRVSAEGVRDLIKQGYIRLGRPREDKTTIQYLSRGEIRKLENGTFTVESRKEDGSVVVSDDGYVPAFLPGTQWRIGAHDSSVNGSLLVRQFLPGRKFPYPKSLYAVEDTLRFFVKNKPNAVVLDFFAGSGTTAHAVMRLNRQDGGRRQCISITNNEVSAEEQVKLRKQGLRAGDSEWETFGICDYITKPRIKAAITGRTPNGDPIKGDYKFTDEFPMLEGFAENAAFFTLTYESPLAVKHNRAFRQIAPMLWMRAGSEGHIIENLSERGWDIADVYGVLEDFDSSSEFLAALTDAQGVRTVFLVTDDDVAYQMVCRDLPETVAPVRLYSSYLLNFEINRRRY